MLALPMLTLLLLLLLLFVLVDAKGFPSDKEEVVELLLKGFPESLLL